MAIQKQKKNQILDEANNIVTLVKENAIVINQGVMRNTYKLSELKKTMDDVQAKVESNNTNMQ